MVCVIFASQGRSLENSNRSAEAKNLIPFAGGLPSGFNSLAATSAGMSCGWQFKTQAACSAVRRAGNWPSSVKNLCWSSRMVDSPFLYFLKISSRAGYAMRACWLAPKVLGRPLRLEHTTAKPATHIIPHPPAPPRVVFVQPAYLFFRIHVFQFRIKTEFIFKQSRPASAAARRRQARELLYSVTTGSIAAA